MTTLFAHPLVRGRSALTVVGVLSSALLFAGVLLEVLLSGSLADLADLANTGASASGTESLSNKMAPAGSAVESVHESGSMAQVLADIPAHSLLPSALVLILVLAGIIGIFAWGWPHLLAVPAVGASRIVVALGGISALLIAAFLPPHFLVLVVAFALPAAFISQMTRGGTHAKALRQISGTFVGVLLLTSASMWLLAARLAPAIALAAASLMLSGALATSVFASQIRSLAVVISALLVAILAAALIPTHPWWASLAFALCYGLTFGALAASSRVTRTVTSFPSAARAMVLVIHCALGVVVYSLALLFA